jgi:predicted secreted hydrolase
MPQAGKKSQMRCAWSDTMVKKTLPILIAALMLLTPVLYFWAVQNNNHDAYTASPVDLLADDASQDGFARALTVRKFTFPYDSGPHPEFQNEWWYYTGNLEDETGRRFGYQITIFRRALTPDLPDAPQRTSKWASRQVYMGHFAVTDVANGNFYTFERFSRAAAGLSGASARPFRVWLEDWEIKEKNNVVRIDASQGEVALSLSLIPEKPIVLNGDRGLSQKGPGQGNASYYYSQTRIATNGAITLAAEKFKVKGLSWLDREWSTSALSNYQAGWDWFSLQLSDGREIMLYQMRKKDGTPDRFSSGTLIDKSGNPRRLYADDFTIEVLNRWKSAHSGILYPMGWRLTVLPAHLTLTVTPLLKDQEHKGGLVYWEGTASVKGEGVSGYGYVELVGYGSG